MAAPSSLNAGAPNAKRLLLVGEASDLATLQREIEAIKPTPVILGAVVLDSTNQAPTQLRTDILGGIGSLAQTLEQFKPQLDQVLVSLSPGAGPEMTEVVRTLNDAGVSWQFRPTLAAQLAGQAEFGNPGPSNPPATSNHSTSTPGRHTPGALDLAKLINRCPHELDETAIREILADRTVMITGAGGSIGTELALAVSRFNPARLVLVERAENPLFEIDQEIARLSPHTPRQAMLHDVTQRQRTDALVQRVRPEVIFHAAAHKHVPMMENHPAEAVENNLYGTRSLADAADRHGVERFVMISSDKAVNPSSVMGATKRLAELYIRHLNGRSGCTFSMVRFGNVLASNCSVLTIWSRQLARGGPITVTHPEMHRYFMTIAEAAGLVLQAAALSGEPRSRLAAGLARRERAASGPAKPPHRQHAPNSAGGEVFLLDMAQPIRILDLAQRFIELHGLTPQTQMPIQITGIRPGEKLFEELSYTCEDMLPTAHDAVRIWNAAPPSEAQIQRITATFDKLRDDHGRKPHPWHQTPAEAITTALRTTIPEMTLAAAG